VIPYLILTATLSGSAGWCWGHSTVRIRIVHVGATRAQDEAALAADLHTRFDEITADFDDPRSNAA
jgi:hypothetical protein